MCLAFCCCTYIFCLLGSLYQLNSKEKPDGNYINLRIVLCRMGRVGNYAWPITLTLALQFKGDHCGKNYYSVCSTEWQNLFW